MRRNTEELREYWPEVKRVFHEALSRPEKERVAFLSTACGGDERVRVEVASLLAVHDGDGGDFLEESALDAAGEALAEEPVEGRRIGPYRVLREIGRGGMGTVFLAERADGEVRKTVAIKLVSRGMDTDVITRRFRYERQILAELDHPHIARFLDAGTEDGLPYFVMECVEGEPIDRYCESRHLSIEKRLDLFGSVCEAVEYAHRHLIVHRDLKPGNIFVTREGVPKLLDFGLAKLLDPDAPGERTALTAEAFRAMTPEYASPEQIRGDAITTATDVYSLGVLLYELLAARHPYPFKTRRPDEIARVICEQVPPRPSSVVSDDQLRRRLRGDLDTIVGKALQKSPERRYPSVGQLSSDIARHREGLPVQARPDTMIYRAGKFVRRHKVSVAAAALVVITLVGGVAATLWQARVAQAEHARAEQRFEDIRRLAGLIVFDYNEAIAMLPGSTSIRERMIADGFEYLSLLAREAGEDPSLRTELADGYVKMGRVQARMGDNAGSLASYRQALGLYRSLAAARPEETQLQRRLAHAYVMLADRLTDAGSAGEALVEHRRALVIRERILAERPQDPQSTRDLLDSVFYMGRALQSMGAYDEGLAHFQRMVTSVDSMASADPRDLALRLDGHTAHHSLAGGLAAKGDLAGAAREYRRALEIGRTLTREEPDNANYWQAFSRTHLRLGRVLGAMGDHTTAVETLQAALAISRRLREQDPSNNETENDLVLIHAALGDELAALGRIEEALARYETSRELGEGAVRRTTMYARVRLALAETHRGLGDLLARSGEPARGLVFLRTSVAAFDSLSAGDPANVALQHERAIAYERLGRALEARAAGPETTASTADMRAACEAYERSTALWERLEREGTLSEVSAERPGEVARSLERCRLRM